MDEATLTIRFKDESSVGPSGVATTSPQYSGSDPGSVKVADQQNAITQAGGVGAMAAKNSQASGGGAQPAPTFAPVPPAAPLPVPPINIGTTPGDPLLKTVQGIQQADPKVTAAEIAAALGINKTQAQSLLTASAVNPGGAGRSTGLPVPGVNSGDDLIFPEDRRRLEADKWIASEQERFAREHQSQSEQERQQREAQAAAAKIPPPLSSEQMLAESARRAPPIQGQPSHADTSGVQNTVNALAHFAHMGGPMGSAIAGAATSAAQIPGVASAIASAAPAAVASAPYVAATAAALAVPAAGYLTLDSIARTARGQIGGFSTDVAQAEAEASVRQMVANMRTAQRLGDEVADYVENRSRTSAAVQGIRDVVAEPLLKEFNKAGNQLAEAAELLNGFLQKNPNAPVWAGRAVMGQAALSAIPPIIPFIVAYEVWSMLSGSKGTVAPPEDNPLTYYKQMPMPKLPYPFEEAGYIPTPIDREVSGMPGLSF